MFQFQYGAIKRRSNRCILTGFASFNSNMVRLKANNVFSAIPAARMFQFQYGAIKSIIFFAFVYYHNSFNSNMVRLKVSLEE